MRLLLPDGLLRLILLHHHWHRVVMGRTCCCMKGGCGLEAASASPLLRSLEREALPPSLLPCLPSVPATGCPPTPPSLGIVKE